MGIVLKNQYGENKFCIISIIYTWEITINKSVCFSENNLELYHGKARFLLIDSAEKSFD